MALLEQPVEFKTLDGLTLRGSLYPAAARGPGIVMTPGFNCVKEMLGLPDVATHFQTHGLTVLLYDPRTTGLSDGTPRNDIDPHLQASDYSDALTFLSTQPTVDPSQLFFWGMSFSAAVALCAASTDKRIRGIIAVAPLTNFTYTPEKLPKVLARCMQDRVSQLAGNEPYYLPMLNEKGENPAGFGVGVDKEQYGRIVNAGKEIARGHVNRTTIQSYYKMVMWQPFGLWEMVRPTPVLFVVPELDRLSPAERQLGHFERLEGPKRLFVQKGVGHMEVVEGAHLAELMGVKMQFLGDCLEGRV
ncbi:alpha/beta-hydrolase [Aspergillus sclerotiicarbonarius CBS 121057]|uniref:Alpha/beta-hydrolase n=1 Tax=Aspergillus sclerotiicarbonarius (strain CBS 121057 / IBT 28362) TaxID=1448318 RepID=A0A319E203_ASPSB|nr:alpha/beta-hydrolase [Aspergillus sclerotiicarbonarius CBS 121057]